VNVDVTAETWNFRLLWRIESVNCRCRHYEINVRVVQEHAWQLTTTQNNNSHNSDFLCRKCQKLDRALQALSDPYYQSTCLSVGLSANMMLNISDDLEIRVQYGAYRKVRIRRVYCATSSRDSDGILVTSQYSKSSARRIQKPEPGTTTIRVLYTTIKENIVLRHERIRNTTAEEELKPYLQVKTANNRYTVACGSMGD